MFSVTEVDEKYVTKCGFNADTVEMLKFVDDEADRTVLNIQMKPEYGVAYDAILIDQKPKVDGTGYEYLVNEGLSPELGEAVAILRDAKADLETRQEAFEAVSQEIDEIEEYGDVAVWHDSDKKLSDIDIVGAVDEWMCTVYDTTSPWRDDNGRNFFSDFANQMLEADMYQRYIDVDSFETTIGDNRAARSKDLRGSYYYPDNKDMVVSAISRNAEAVHDFVAQVDAGKASVRPAREYEMEC